MRLDTSDRWAALGLAVWAAAVGAYLARTLGPAQLFWDDGFYYLQIARNLADGAGSTVDGLHPTNGYHPLWLLSLIPIFILASSSTQALWAVVGLQLAALAVSAGLLYRLVRYTAGRWASVIAVMAWVWLSHRLALSGLEYAVHVTVLLGAGCYYARHFTKATASGGEHLALGCLAALAFLSRLDAGLLVLTLTWASTRRRSAARVDIRRLTALIGPTVVAGLCYVTVNMWFFGAATPVSAAVKRAWSQLALQQDPVYQQAGWLVAKVVHWWWPLADDSGVRLTLVGGTWIIGGLWVARRRLHLDQLDTLAPLIVYSNLSYGLYALVYHGVWSQTPWYYAVTPMLGAVLLAVVADQAGRRVSGLTATHNGITRQPGRWLATAAVLLGVVAIPAKTLLDLQALRPAVGPAFAPALTAIAALPPNAILASWNSGTLSYRSERTVVNLDGLVNSWQYHLDGRRDLCGYWRRTGVTHVVDFFDFAEAPPRAPILASYRSLYDYSPCHERLRLVWAHDQLPATERLAIFAFDPSSD